MIFADLGKTHLKDEGPVETRPDGLIQVKLLSTLLLKTSINIINDC